MMTRFMAVGRMTATRTAVCFTRSRIVTWAFWGTLLVGFALRAWLAVTDDGIYWPDEVYQSFEPAHRLVFGYGLVSWEFVQGARNWTLPALVALLMKLSETVGFHEPREYITVVKIFFALWATATAWAAYRMARAAGAEGVTAPVAGALCALTAPAIYFSARAFSETASALPAVLGLAFALKKAPRRWELLLGASLLGLAVMLRLHSALFCLGLLAILASRGEWRRAIEAGGALLFWAFLLGLVDHLTWSTAPGATWDGWFNSPRRYLVFILVEGGSRSWGVSDAGYYFRHLFLTMPALSILLGLLSIAALRRGTGLALTVFAFLALHTWIGHKELRFVYPVLPLLCALAGVGLSTLPRRVVPYAIAVTTVAALWSAVRFQSLTMGDVGQYPDRRTVSAFDDMGPVNRMLLAAHDRPDMCGLRVDVVPLAWSGGSTYLHRRVPLYDLGQPPTDLRRFNYVIAWDSSGPPGVVVARDPRVPQIVLRRLPIATCTPDPGYSWRLP